VGESKRYYWLKLDRNFFKRHDIRIIEALDNGKGKEYVLFYLKMLVESIDHDGALRFSQSIPYDEQMLSVVTNTDLEIVGHAIDIFKRYGLMEIDDDGTIFMTGLSNMVGSEADSTARVRKYRENIKKALQCNTDETSSSTEETSGNQSETQSKSKRKSEKKSKEKEKEKEPEQDLFEHFWAVYPRKVGKKDAVKAWNKLEPDETLTHQIIEGVERWKLSTQWTKDGGQYIPYPATFLNGERWKDECDIAVTKPRRNDLDEFF
jgi:predicted phage replisome organizer